jgi:hypothetical protein
MRGSRFGTHLMAWEIYVFPFVLDESLKILLGPII